MDKEYDFYSYANRFDPYTVLDQSSREGSNLVEPNERL